MHLTVRKTSTVYVTVNMKIKEGKAEHTFMT